MKSEYENLHGEGKIPIRNGVKHRNHRKQNGGWDNKKWISKSQKTVEIPVVSKTGKNKNLWEIIMTNWIPCCCVKACDFLILLILDFFCYSLGYDLWEVYCSRHAIVSSPL